MISFRFTIKKTNYLSVEHVGLSKAQKERWIIACPQCPQNLSHVQEKALLLEADMCVKEVEGAWGQESPYRQEKACGGDGGAGGSWLLCDGCLFNTQHYTQRHCHTVLQACSHWPLGRKGHSKKEMDDFWFLHTTSKWQWRKKHTLLRAKVLPVTECLLNSYHCWRFKSQCTLTSHLCSRKAEEKSYNMMQKNIHYIQCICSFSTCFFH